MKITYQGLKCRIKGRPAVVSLFIASYMDKPQIIEILNEAFSQSAESCPKTLQLFGISNLEVTFLEEEED